MKVSYAQNPTSPEPVAYIDRDGDLIIKDDMGSVVLFQLDKNCFYTQDDWEPYHQDVKRHFYKGDSVTITF